jgi:cytochrome c oxidase subunit 2
MQMKIVVDTPEEYKAWLKSKTGLVQSVKTAAIEDAKAKEAEANPTKSDSTKVKKDTTVVAVAQMK